MAFDGRFGELELVEIAVMGGIILVCSAGLGQVFTSEQVGGLVVLG